MDLPHSNPRPLRAQPDAEASGECATRSAFSRRVDFNDFLQPTCARQADGPRRDLTSSRPARLSRCAESRLEPKENRPMTVRWKPLLVLSGLFVAVALGRRGRHHGDAGPAVVARAF